MGMLWKAQQRGFYPHEAYCQLKYFYGDAMNMCYKYGGTCMDEIIVLEGLKAEI